MWLAGIGRHDCFLKREKLFAAADHETVVRNRDNIGQLPAWEIESDRHPTRAGVGRVIRNERIRSAIRESNCYGRRRSLKISGFGKGHGVARWRKRSLAYEAFRMDEAIAGFISRNLEHGFENL